MDHATASELLGAFALDACDEEEAAAVRAHIAQCPICAEETRRLAELAGWIGAGLAEPTDDRLRAEVLGDGAPAAPEDE